MAPRGDAPATDSASRTLVLGIDGARRIVQCGPNARAVLGRDPQDLIGRPATDLVGDEAKAELESLLEVGDQERNGVMTVLRESARDGRTIVLTTQILHEAEELCDDILIVNHGREVARGDLNTLKLLASGVYEVSITFDRVPEALEAEIARRGPLRFNVAGNTVEFALKESESRVLELVTDLSRRAQVLRVEIGGASLEDVFVQLMERPAPKEGVLQS